MNRILRFTILLAVCLVIIYFSDIPNKFPLMIGATLGVFFGFIAGHFINKKKGKNHPNKDE